MANVKGTALGWLKRYVEAHHGERGVETWLEGLDAGESELIRGGLILPNSWYPVITWNHLVDRYVMALGGGVASSFGPVAHEIAANDLYAFFKVLLKQGSPVTVLRRASSLWERYFDAGKMEPEERAANHFFIRLSCPTAEDKAPGPVTCAHGVPAWQQRALEIMGATDVRIVHLRCRFHGAAVCEYDVTWMDPERRG